MDNQHKLIKGYRDLSQEEIDQINAIKILGTLIQNQVENTRDISGVDQEWVNQAELQLKTGIMYLVRAIAKPQGF